MSRGMYVAGVSGSASLPSANLIAISHVLAADSTSSLSAAMTIERPFSRAARVPPPSRARRACRAELSRLEGVEELRRQRRIEVVADRNAPAFRAEHALALGQRHRHETRDRHARARDVHLLSIRDALEKLGQLGLGFVHVVRPTLGHGHNMTNAVD